MSSPPMANPPIVLPKQGVARVQSVLSGDTVILLGKSTNPNQPPPTVTFTLSSVSAPRLASKTNPTDEPGAFPAREWLRRLVVGKSVRFETLRQGGSAGDRVYGWLFVKSDNGSAGGGEDLHLAVECVRQGYATPKAVKFPGTGGGGGGGAGGGGGGEDGEGADLDDGLSPERDYEQALMKAYEEAMSNKRGIHASAPLVRKVKNAVDDYPTMSLVEACQKHGKQGKITCIIEYVFDGSRMRCQVVDPDFLPDYQNASFTLLLAGISCPRVGNPSRGGGAAPDSAGAEEFGEQARQFTQLRLLQRELPVTLVGTDKSGGSVVGIVHHPVGNIAVELLKVGFAKMTDWSVRLMTPAHVPALRVAENNAKRAGLGIWHSYAPPVLSLASADVRGTVVEVVSGDTIVILPTGKIYDSDDVLVKVSLASIRSPRVGNERAGRADEPYAVECKDRLRTLVVGKEVQVTIHYERDIPVQPGVTEKRPFGTVAVLAPTGDATKYDDVSEVLLREGLAVTQRHRDEDEKSPRYDELLAAEAVAKAAGKGQHAEKEYKRQAVNDLTDQRKAKGYSGSLMRAGTLKAMVDHVFNGALFKLYIPSENCFIRFSPGAIRCPQPSPSAGSKTAKAGEPFGDEAKRHARLHTMQRQVEITCSGVTNSGIITGNMYLTGSGPRRDYTIELIGAGLATVDQRKIDYGEAPKYLVDAQAVAQGNKIGLWSLETSPISSQQVTSKSAEKSEEKIVTIRLSEIRSGSHFFFHLVDDAPKLMDESMKAFTQNHGTAGAPCDVKNGKIVAALFDDGTGKSWYRAKIVEKKGPGKVGVLFLDHGNLATVPVATHLRPLDVSLSTDRIPPIAREAVLALTVTRPLEKDEGVDAARMLQSLCWGKDLTARLLATDENGKLAIAIVSDGTEETINAELIAAGLAVVPKQRSIDILARGMVQPDVVVKLASDLSAAQTAARKARVGMWRYGDVGDDDDDDAM